MAKLKPVSVEGTKPSQECIEANEARYSRFESVGQLLWYFSWKYCTLSLTFGGHDSIVWGPWLYCSPLLWPLLPSTILFWINLIQYGSIAHSNVITCISRCSYVVLNGSTNGGNMYHIFVVENWEVVHTSGKLDDDKSPAFLRFGSAN